MSTGTVNNGTATIQLDTTGMKKGKHILRTRYTTNTKYKHNREGANTLTLNPGQGYIEPEDETTDITTPTIETILPITGTPANPETITQGQEELLDVGRGYTILLPSDMLGYEYLDVDFTIRAEIRTDRTDTLIGFIYENGHWGQEVPYMETSDDLGFDTTNTGFQVFTARFRDGHVYFYLDGDYTGYSYDLTELDYYCVHFAVQSQQTRSTLVRSVEYLVGTSLFTNPTANGGG